MLVNMGERQSSSAPTVPEELSHDIVRYVDGASSEELRALIRYVEAVESSLSSEWNSSDSEYGTSARSAQENAKRTNRNDVDAGIDSSVVERDSGDRDEQNGDAGNPSNGPSSDVPQKATLTIKEINDNRYYYWQWRDGDKIRSKYKGPVSDDT